MGTSVILSLNVEESAKISIRPISAWLLFTASIMSDNGIRNEFIEDAWARAGQNTFPGAMPNRYNDETGALLASSGAAGCVILL